MKDRFHSFVEYLKENLLVFVIRFVSVLLKTFYVVVDTLWQLAGRTRSSFLKVGSFTETPNQAVRY